MVPTVTLLDQETLDRRGIDVLERLQLELPALVAGGGRDSLVVRGLGDAGDGAMGDPGVALHLDGIYLSRPSLLRVGFHDLERVDVARGPQGARYARHTGGAVDLVTRGAEHDSSMALDVEYGNRENVRARGMLNLPLDPRDTAAIRIAVLHDRNGGFYRQRLAGDRVFDRTDTAVRVSLRVDPVDALRIDVGYTLLDRDAGGPDSKLVGDPAATGSGGVVVDDFTGALATPPSPRIGNEDRRGDLDERMHLVYLRGTAALGSALELVSSTAYQQYESRTLFDADHTELAVRDAEQFAELYAVSQDLVLRRSRADDRRLSGALGVNVFHEAQRGTGSDSLQLQQSSAIQALLPGLNADLVAAGGTPFPLDFEDRLRLDAHGENTSWSVFADGAFAITDAWRVLGGVRGTGMHRDFRDRSRSADSVPFPGEPAEFVETLGVDQSKSWTAVTGHVGTDLTLEGGATLFASFAASNRPGGFQPLQVGAFDDEQVLGVEAGLRHRDPEGRWDAAVRGFWNDVSDTPVLVRSGDAARIATVPEARVAGVELEWDVRPLEPLRWNGSFGYLFAEYGDDGGLGVEGERMARAPEISLNTGLEWRHVISSRIGSVSLRADYTFRDALRFDAFGSAALRSGRAHLGDLRAVFDSEWNAVGLRVEAFVLNVGDEAVATNVVPTSAGLNAAAFFNEPRLYGGRLTALF